MKLHSKKALALKYLRLVLRVTPEHISATGLEIPRCNQDYIAVLDPDTPLHFASNATDSVGSVWTLHHYSIVPEHLGYNPKQLAYFRKNELIDVSFRKDLSLSQFTLPILQGDGPILCRSLRSSIFAVEVCLSRIPSANATLAPKRWMTFSTILYKVSS